MDELAQQRQALEQEQAKDPEQRRAFEISSLLVRLEGEEQFLKLRMFASAHAANSLDFMNELQALGTTLSETAHWLWRDTASILLAIERRRHRRNARYRWIYGAVLGGYAVVVVTAGVAIDAGLALTPIAGILTSLAAAFGLAALDRWLIAPRLERWQRRRNIRLLKDELAACAITFANIRLVQVELDAMASYTGVPKKQLLSPALLA